MVKIYGIFKENTGYGVLNKQITKHLVKQGVVIEAHDCVSNTESLYVPETGLLNFSKPVSIYSKVYTDGLELNKDEYNVLFAMNESNDLSNYDILRTKQFDEIWIPSTFCEMAYKKHFTNVYKIPLGIDENQFQPKKIKHDKFRFISVFSWSFRKGHDVLLKSYYETFNKNDNVVLTIITKILGKSSILNTLKIIDNINQYKNNYNNTADVELIVHNISTEELCNIYNQSNCFILPSRGEGFCLPALEAAYMNIPIITTNHSGYLDFLNSDNATLIDIDDFIAIGDDQFFNSSYYNTLKFPRLGDKVKQEFSYHMKNIYNDSQEYDNKANNFIREHSWYKTSQLIIERLRSINTIKDKEVHQYAYGKNGL